MRILSLETGCLTAVVAAVEVEDGSTKVIALQILKEPRGLARDLIGEVDAVLGAANWQVQELDGIAVGTGPGSWTSLRVGLTTAKTLAQIVGIPLAGVPTFDAVASAAAEELTQNEIFLAAAPCRPGEFYGQVFRLAPGTVSPLNPVNIAPKEAHFATVRTHTDGEFAIGGDAAPDLSTTLAHRIGNNSPEKLIAAVARLGAAKITAGSADDPLGLVPLYLAPSNAERNLPKP